MKYRIVNLQACDLYQVIDNKMVSSGLTLKHMNKDGELRNSRWMYTAMFNESMLCDKFEKLIERGDIVKKSDAIFPKPNKNTTTLYTNQIIQLKFEYSVKDETVEAKKLRKSDKSIKAPKTYKTREEVRKYVYENGFDIDGVHYVRWMRSGGSARVGKVLFINEKLAHSMDLKSNAKVNLTSCIDLASYEAYRSLMLSTKIDEIEIKPENILLVSDWESVFTEKCNVTTIKRKHLSTNMEDVEVHNSIWDGQSLIDPSLMVSKKIKDGKEEIIDYSHKGMLLLRNVMFKSCCFNANIQQWFADNGITEVSQLNGQTIAKDIKDIKLITTPSSIKYKKFGKKDTWFTDWLALAENAYGIVKYEKPPKHQKSTMVSTHYQLINTLDLSVDDIDELIKPSIERINAVVTDPNEMLEYCSDYAENDSIQTKKELVYKLLMMNMDVASTSFYANLTKKIKEEMRGDIKQGRILVDGNYSTLCGNPIEMLQHAIGQFNGESVIGVGNVVSKRFGVEELLVCRSPHITMGNVYVTNNTVNELINTYMNFTKEIIGINSINENTLQRLQGCDFDSDTALITNNSVLINAAKKYYNKFKVPFNAVKSKAELEKESGKEVVVGKEYTMANLAELDHKTSVNLIGEIVNLSQLLNSIYWHRKSENAPYKELAKIYTDICTLSVMSGIEIDKAKKEFDIDSEKELAKIRNKYTGMYFPQFFMYIDKLKSTKREIKRKGYATYNCSMDRLYGQIVNKRLEVCKADGDIIKVIAGYNDKRTVNKVQADMIIDACMCRLSANEAISKEDGEAKMQMKYLKDLDLFEAFEYICKSKLSVNTIRYCVSVFKKMDKGNALTEYMLLGLITCKESTVVKALRPSKTPIK